MEATFVVNPKEVNAQLIERMLDFFTKQDGPVAVHMKEAYPQPFDFQQWFQGMEAIRAKSDVTAVPATIGDLNDLIDSINDMDFDQP